MNNKQKQKVKQLLPYALVKIIIFCKRKFNNKPTAIYNLGWNPFIKYKVLVLYIPDFVFKKNFEGTIGTKEKECSCLVKALINEGCVVDVQYVGNTKNIASDYDIIIGQGVAFRNARSLNPQAKSVLYLTEKTPAFSFAKEQERVDYLYERHHIKCKIERSGKFFIDEDFSKLDYCIMIGKQGDEHLVNHTKTFVLNPSGLKNHKFRLINKNICYAKNHFLWIGSFGAVHKGLDILFDVFRLHPEFTLHVCGLQPVDRKLLKALIPDNVIDYGYVVIDSDEFLDIADKCAFILYPSCSEGVATSVITAMNHGLIPLVSEESSLNLGEIGEIMHSFKVEDIEKVILKWTKTDDEDLIMQCKKTIDLAEREYSIDKYSENIQKIVQSILFNDRKE